MRTKRKKVHFRNSEHDYEPIAAPSPASAPVVRITDTDVAHVADSDESVDDRVPPELTKDGDVVLPLDGRIEDNAMEARELGETGDTSEEQEPQERLEDRFLSVPTPGTESRTDGEVNTSQVDSLALEELPLQRGARGLPQRLKTQAGKLRTRLRNIHRPTFAFSERQKPEKTKSASSGRSDRSRSEKRPSRMDRIRSSFSERPRFSLPARPKFSLPDRSKFHLPERPKFHLPERPKFNIKKPNIKLPNALTRGRKSPTAQQQQQRSTDSTIGSRRNIFDFSTYPRIFDKKSKTKGEYATSTPKDSRATSAESATFPRARKGSSAAERWAQRFDDTAYIDEDRPDAVTTVERSRPWRHPSLEQPRLSISVEEQAVLAAIPWEEKRRREQEELQFMDYEQESPEVSERQGHPRSTDSRTEEESYERERVEIDPRLYDDQRVYARDNNTRKDHEDSEHEDWREEERMIIRTQDDFRPMQRSLSLGEDVRPFGAIDPRRYGAHKTPSEEEEYEEEMEGDEEQEPSSAQSDREQQQSSGSSCDRRRRGVIEEMDSDEFFLRASGINRDDIKFERYLTNEIRDALISDMTNALADDSILPGPPQRPMRKGSLRKRKEDSVESYDIVPPVRPKRDSRGRRSESGEDFRDRTRSDSRHRVVYQAEGSPREMTPMEPLDDIVVVKPMRRKSRSLQRSQSQVSTEPVRPPSPSPLPPVVPLRRKRSRRETAMERRNGDVGPMCNGHTEWAATDSAPDKPLPLPPTNMEELPDDREVFTAEEILAASQEDFRKFATRLQDEEYVGPVPVPPKRRSRSRGTSVAQDEDRTSHGAESLPEAGYIEDDIPRDDLDFGRDLSGYAIIEKREKPPRPPPPRRRRDKFATTPRSVGPKRPLRAYSTLGPAKSRETSIMSDTISGTLEPGETTPYIEIDSDGEHKDLRSGQVLSKMQGRPLPAPPRPPRLRKDRSLEGASHSIHEFSMETTTATQTDPLPDDMIIEEEITQAKLVVAPSRSGSQILVSTERIPTPSSMFTPSVPPLPGSQRQQRRDERTIEPSYDTVSLKSPSPIRDLEDLENRHLSAPHLDEPRDEDAHIRAIRSALLTEETVRIGNLEVGDLRVDRLSVSQIEASKIVASEVDALLITASELKNIGGSLEENLSPSIIKELIAIRSHLESVAAARAQEIRSERTRALEASTKPDIPVTDTRNVDDQPASGRQASAMEDEKSKSNEDQKVIKREVIEVKDKETPLTHTLSVAQVDLKDREMPMTHTLSVSQVEIKDKETPKTHSLLVVQSTEDKSLRILDTESPLSLSPRTGKELKVEESRASLPPSPRESPERRLASEQLLEHDRDSVETRLSPDRVTELPKDTMESRLSPEPSHESTIENGKSRLSPERTTESTRETKESRLSPEHAFEAATEESEAESKPPPEFLTFRSEHTDKDESGEKKTRKSRSRSPSPIRGTRQTASPVRSLPPAISVTPDEPDVATVLGITSEIQPQRAVISYNTYAEQSDRESQRESSQSPITSFPMGGTHFIAFPASQVPAQFFSLAAQSSQRIDSDPSITDTTRQLLRALRLAGIKAMRHFVGYLSSISSGEETREKIREVELTLCALLLLVAGLLIFFFSSTRTVTHHHHWDYFNPPK